MAMMSFAIPLTSFWRFALETAIYLPNLVPSKTIFKTPIELWFGRKLSMKYIYIWGCPAHMLKESLINWNQREKYVCLLGIQQKAGVNCSIVIEDDYVNNFKAKSCLEMRWLCQINQKLL